MSDETLNADSTGIPGQAPIPVFVSFEPDPNAPAPAAPAPPAAPTAPEVNLIDSPPHYTAGAVEVIDYIEQVVDGYPPSLAYHVGNALKYLSRAPLKSDLKQDLEKATWYLKRAISRLP